MAIKATAKSSFVQGQPVHGVYCNVAFTGKINENTRATPDGRNLIFGIVLNVKIMVFGQSRKYIEIATGENLNEVFFS